MERILLPLSFLRKTQDRSEEPCDEESKTFVLLNDKFREFGVGLRFFTKRCYVQNDNGLTLLFKSLSDQVVKCHNTYDHI